MAAGLAARHRRERPRRCRCRRPRRHSLAQPVPGAGTPVSGRGAGCLRVRAQARGRAGARRRQEGDFPPHQTARHGSFPDTPTPRASSPLERSHMLSGCCLRGDGSGDKETGGRGARVPGAPTAPWPAPQRWRGQTGRGGGSLPVRSRPGAAAGSSGNNACPGHPDIPPAARAARRSRRQRRPPAGTPLPGGAPLVPPGAGGWGSGPAAPVWGLAASSEPRWHPESGHGASLAPPGDSGGRGAGAGARGGRPPALPREGGAPGARPPARAAATRHGCRSQAAQTLSRDFTAALGRMSQAGRGAQRQPLPRGGPLAPCEPRGGPRCPGCASPRPAPACPEPAGSSGGRGTGSRGGWGRQG